MKKWDSGNSKKYSGDGQKHNEFSRPYSNKFGFHGHNERKKNEAHKTKTSEDKLSTLKSYRRAKGLCFKCGEKWSHGHKCPPSISLHAMEEVWQFLSDDNPETPVSEGDDQESRDDLMAISLQAIQGIEGSQTI